jgi:hypothetical protein
VALGCLSLGYQVALRSHWGGFARFAPNHPPPSWYEGDHGGVLLPEAKLTSEAFAKAGDKIVPIGQLWLRKLTPMRDGSALASDKLRVATVRHKDQDVSLAQCALSVRRNRSDALELLVFGKDKEPLVIRRCPKLPVKTNSVQTPTAPVKQKAKDKHETPTPQSNPRRTVPQSCHSASAPV